MIEYFAGILVHMSDPKRKAIMERIFDRSRANDKLVYNKASKDVASFSSLTDYSYNLNDLNRKELSTNSISKFFVDEIEKLFLQPQIWATFISESHKDISIVSEKSLELRDDAAKYTITLVDTKNPTILLLLVPLSGYILIRSEEEKF